MKKNSQMDNWQPIDIQYIKDNFESPYDFAFGMFYGYFHGICNTFNQHAQCSDCCFTFQAKWLKNTFQSDEDLVSNVLNLNFTPTWKVIEDKNWENDFREIFREVFYNMNDLGFYFQKQTKEYPEALFCFERGLENIVLLINFLTSEVDLKIFNFSPEKKYPTHIEYLFRNKNKVLHFRLLQSD
jgi:hypothetical protein